MAIKKSPTAQAQNKSGTGKLGVSKKTSDSVVARKTPGLTVSVYDIKGKIVGKASLPKEIFGAKINATLMAQAVRVYLANQRQGTASTKTRGEVKGSTRKIWRQKHTGRARHGAIRAPIFVGGGIVFGPKPRDFQLKLPKKMRKRALVSALALKLKERAIKVVQNFENIKPKTKALQEFLKKLVVDKKVGKIRYLLVIPNKMENVYMAARNLKFVDVQPPELLNTYEVLSHRQIVFTKDAIAALEKTYEVA